MSTAIPLHALFAADGISPNPDLDARQALTAADVIVGVDVMSKQEFVLYGKKTLEKIARQKKGQNISVFRIELDEDNGDLERAAALVTAVKGRCDY